MTAAQLEAERRYVTMTVRRMVQPNDVDDLAQEVLLKAWRYRDRYNERYSLRTWLRWIIRSVVIDFARTQPKAWVAPVPPEDLLGIPDAAAGPESLVLGEQRYQELVALVNGLSPAYRDACRLVWLQGLSYQETADALSIELGTVRSRVFRGNKVLRNTRRTEEVLRR